MKNSKEKCFAQTKVQIAIIEKEIANERVFKNKLKGIRAIITKSKIKEKCTSLMDGVIV